jgi:hypothetical protein
MTKIKTLGTAVLLIATVAAPVFAQDKGELGSRHGLEPTTPRRVRGRVRTSECATAKRPNQGISQ